MLLCQPMRSAGEASSFGKRPMKIETVLVDHHDHVIARTGALRTYTQFGAVDCNVQHTDC